MHDGQRALPIRITEGNIPSQHDELFPLRAMNPWGKCPREARRVISPLLEICIDVPFLVIYVYVFLKMDK